MKHALKSIQLAEFPEGEGRVGMWRLNILLREWNHQSLVGGKESRRAPVFPPRGRESGFVAQTPHSQ